MCVLVSRADGAFGHGLNPELLLLLLSFIQRSDAVSWQCQCFLLVVTRWPSQWRCTFDTQSEMVRFTALQGTLANKNRISNGSCKLVFS